jgi:hypothetical protein
MALSEKKDNGGNPLELHTDYSMLGLPDLLLARERNHLELMRKENVVGTAVGLYLIRRSDPWPPAKAPKSRNARTLANSEVRPYSWPCILVFVDKWDDEKNINWENMVPKSLYLEDGRKVPVCVVEAPPAIQGQPVMRNVVFPSTHMGGGFPVLIESQGREHVASIGCLLSDGHTTYALTNRHVTGEAGTPVTTRIGGAQVQLGTSDSRQLTRKPFQEIYPGWAGKSVYLTLDVGLIRIDDLTNWTAQVFGLGTLGEIADLGMDNLTLRLIDCPVRAYGCASGPLKGEIKALFYRYRSMGGFEYVSDFLIGARSEKKEDAFQTHPGDSGTLWLLEKDGELRPLAVQWGGTLFYSDSGKPQVSCALATCLSTVCNLLEVDVVRDWNEGSFEYWGEMGHYTIGALSCTVNFTGLPKLQKLMSANIDRVGFKPADLKQKEKILRGTAQYDFVPLADVADDVWRNTRKSDENNHFADMDQVAPSGKYRGQSLLDLCQKPSNIDPQVWLDFYSTLPDTNPGSLPFRVWQIYDEMVDYAKRGDAVHFLAAGGCLAHYIGDACQPLHISRLHHGNPPVKKGSVAYQVHAVYETQMLNAKSPEIVDGVVARLKGKSVKATFTTGFDAAQRVIELMQGTVKKLPPASIVKTYNDAASKAARLTDLWSAHGQATMDVMADGCLCLAEVWASAWKEGGGENVANSELGAADFDTLQNYYNDSSFLPSVGLARLAQILKKPTGAGPALVAPPSGPAPKQPPKRSKGRNGARARSRRVA